MRAASDFPPPPADDAPVSRHMHYAACTDPGYPSASKCAAAEILALAMKMLPLEREVQSDSAPDCPIWARWDERRRLRDWLAEEYRKAERGE